MKPTFPFPILYEDNHLIVVAKPARLLTQPNETSDSSLVEMLKDWIKERDKKPGNVFLGVVHRLDRPVSGIIIFAKTSKALTRLNAAMRSKQCHKTYIGLVEGKLRPEKGTLENYLVHDDYRARVTAQNHPQAKLARLHYTTLKQIQGLSLVEIDLETGRYHQIRCQMAAAGCPIVGDVRYGSQLALKNGAIALHHVKFQIEHPVKKTLMVFETPEPDFTSELIR